MQVRKLWTMTDLYILQAEQACGDWAPCAEGPYNSSLYMLITYSWEQAGSHLSNETYQVGLYHHTLNLILIGIF